MEWNWQHRDWPNFRYDGERLRELEREYLYERGVLEGTQRYLEDEEKESLREALGSSKTEIMEGGEGNEGMLVNNQVTHRDGWGEVALGYELKEARKDRRLSERGGCEEKVLLGNGVQNRNEMSREVRRKGKSGWEVVFEAPPRRLVKGEMDRYVHWFNYTKPGGKGEIPGLIRAGIAHLYFMCIRPLEERNGEIGRMLSETAIVQDCGGGFVVGLGKVLEARRESYLEALRRNNQGTEVTDWLVSFSEMVIESLKRTTEIVDCMMKKKRLYEGVRGSLNKRQREFMKWVIKGGARGVEEFISAEEYLGVTGTSRATATRDLRGLVDIGVLVRSGQLKLTRYGVRV